MIYHITTEAEWMEAVKKGYYEAPSLADEGFIHLSREHQVPDVLKRYYAGKTGLVKLVVDPDKLQHPLKFELAPSVYEEFPHVYGPINLDAVIRVEKLINEVED